MKSGRPAFRMASLSLLLLGTGIAVGQSHGSIFAWGSNGSGQCNAPR